MKYLIQAPEAIHSVVQLPASKSISNRALIIHALCNSDSPLENLSDCDDTDVMIAALTQGKSTIDIKAAGTAMRFLTAYLAQQPGEWILTGTERMKNRPIRILFDALRTLGGQPEYLEKEGYPPLKITGTTLKGGTITLDGSISSQYISALLMIAPKMHNGLKIDLSGTVISKPYIHLTLSLMREFGIESNWTGNTISIAPQAYKPTPFVVESDWSAASYWYQMAALCDEQEIELLGLKENSYQGDARLTEIFSLLGITTHYTERGVLLRKQKEHCDRFVYDFVDQPDLAQTFVVTSALMNIPFRFTGLQSLKIKETDRIHALIEEMKKLGYRLRESEENVLEWNGERCTAEEVPVIATYEDHRMAMAFAPAALKLKEIRIEDPQVVSKSYPNYWENLKQAGFTIHTENI
ncbi:MAG: 3-phosphoshikimate 1-carboxyvinyltransferase [Bacteroidales bacterium]|nr:3-phosphoshikimate 1-carboxyvinyltransferase [Bacteroidales bacterium]